MGQLIVIEMVVHVDLNSNVYTSILPPSSPPPPPPGFTANAIGDTQVPEFWVNNALYQKLNYAAVPLNCSKSSDPIEQQSVVIAGEYRGFVPALVGYRGDY